MKNHLQRSERVENNYEHINISVSIATITLFKSSLLSVCYSVLVLSVAGASTEDPLSTELLMYLGFNVDWLIGSTE